MKVYYGLKNSTVVITGVMLYTINNGMVYLKDPCSCDAQWGQTSYV